MNLVQRTTATSKEDWSVILWRLNGRCCEIKAGPACNTSRAAVAWAKQIANAGNGWSARLQYLGTTIRHIQL